MTTTRTAILMTADWIECHPEKYNFLRLEIPTARSDDGCLLGWMCHFSGVGQGFFSRLFSSSLTSGRISRLLREPKYECDPGRNVLFWRLNDMWAAEGLSRQRHWAWDARTAAYLLRQYADKYYPTNHRTSYKSFMRSIREEAAEEPAMFI